MERGIDGVVLRDVMREVPSPVTVVTLGGPTEMRGITIGSFASTSLHPPLISFNVSRDAQIFDALVVSDRFAVHVLSDRQAHLADHFATPDQTSEQQFDDVAYRVDPLGTPVLLDVLAVLYCERYEVTEAGDHSIVVGRVTSVEIGEEGRPLLYYNRSYRHVGREVGPTTFDPVD